MLLSSVCFVNSYASSVCNVNSNWSNGSSAVGNTCTVTTDIFNPQYSNNYQGAALVSGNGSVLTVKGDLSNIAPGERGITDELKQLKELDSNTIGKTKLEMGVKNEVITITDSGGQSYTINVYPPQSFIETDWGDSKYLTPKAVQDNQYISAGFGKAENGGHLIVDLDNFKGNGFLDPKRTVYLAHKNSNLTWADGEGSVVEWKSKNSFESKAYALSEDAILNNISVPRFPRTFIDYKGESRTISNVEGLKAYNSVLISALKDPRYPSFKTQTDYDAALSAAQPRIKDIPINGPGTGIAPEDKVFQDQGDSRAMYASNRSKIVVTSTGQLDTSFDPTKMAGAMVAEGASEVLIEKGGIVSSRGNSTIILGKSFNGPVNGVTQEIRTKGTNYGVVNSGFHESVIHDTTVNNDNEFYSGSAVEAFFGGEFINNGIVNVAVNRSAEQKFAYNNGLYLSSVGLATNNGIINVGVNNDGLPGRTAGVAIESQYSSFVNADNGVIYIGRAAQNNPTTPETVADTSNANNILFYGILASNNAVATNNGTIIIGTKMQNAAAIAADIPSAGGVSHALKLINNGIITINGSVSAASGEGGARNYGIKAVNNGAIVKENDTTINEVTNNGKIELNGVNGVGVYVLSQKFAQTGADDAFVTLSKDSKIYVSSSEQTDKLIRNYGVWVEGRPDDTHRTKAFIDGTIELAGDGAVGVYVRDGGYASVTENAKPKFTSGKRQIAFYVFGKGSEIVNSARNMEVSAAQSNLFRMDGGATFFGHGEHLTASGENSVIIEGAGVSSSGERTKIETKDAHLTVSNKGAAAVFINGGAYRANKCRRPDRKKNRADR